jgi:tetratricopeptide (TPR) repeat protein
MADSGDISNARKAQEIAYNAMEYMYDDEKKAASLCRKALAIYPDCVDALSMLAEIEAASLEDYIILMEKAVKAGRKYLGNDCFEQECGSFWGLLETRPFMRAMAQLGLGYMQLGKEGYDKAKNIFEEMLVLNPNDNQGMRDILLGCYLATKCYESAGDLIRRYKNDTMAIFMWSRVLHDYVTKGPKKAEKTFKLAMESNFHVLKYLSGKKRLPRVLPAEYSPGEENEALYCAGVLKKAWVAHPKAKQWLKEQC